MASAKFVKDLLEDFRHLGCKVWLDGGWGVDALLGQQTRAHGDVDIVLEERYVGRVCDRLRSNGFAPAPTVDACEWNFVFARGQSERVDFHVVTFDAAGHGIYGPLEHGAFYPADAFTGRGSVGGVPVACMSATFQVANRVGYPLRPQDHHDLKALRSAFGICAEARD